MGSRRRSHNRYDDDGTTLYVRQVHYAARPDDLRVVFERIGPLRDVYIPLDYYSRESRGFAYIKYEDSRDAERAFKELHGCAILGRRICVEWAEGERKCCKDGNEREGLQSVRSFQTVFEFIVFGGYHVGDV
ncbi:unnamed protein product [Anisakis simplex]|uniref:Putative serine/arginine rich splicing factor (inferred by orthology to a S. mansoni protein) n=1 Tax=Anisakis simplex TaxID=6269 RepID=A0A0M3JS79_ANISI|nr:unnamed protein product [Anisakis simplex]